MTRRMYAQVSNQGTAISETALCSGCAPWCGYVDCTSNEQLECQRCGWPQASDPPDEKYDLVGLSGVEITMMRHLLRDHWLHAAVIDQMPERVKRQAGVAAAATERWTEQARAADRLIHKIEAVMAEYAKRFATALRAEEDR